MGDDQKGKQPIAKGGSRGGTRYPHLNLVDALTYAEKLVRKTHTGPQSEQTILIGVFDNKGPVGKVRASALKQYGLLDGEAAAYSASDLAKAIEAATPEEKPKLYRKAFLTPKLFKQIFQTLHGDTVSRARIRQVAISEEVHPTSADESVEYFVSGAIKCGLGSTVGDDLKLLDSDADAANTPPSVEPVLEDEHHEETDTLAATTTDEIKDKTLPPAEKKTPLDPPSPANPATKHAGVTVAFNLDSTFDTDKLQRQLELLRKFNVI